MHRTARIMNTDHVHRTPHTASANGGESLSTYARLLSLDSAFYHPRQWKSWYVKRLTLNLSIEDSIRRHPRRASSQLLPSPSGPIPSAGAANQTPQSKMIKAMHQYSTIKTTYSNDKKSFVSDV